MSGSRGRQGWRDFAKRIVLHEKSVAKYRLDTDPLQACMNALISCHPNEEIESNANQRQEVAAAWCVIVAEQYDKQAVRQHPK